MRVSRAHVYGVYDAHTHRIRACAQLASEGRDLSRPRLPLLPRLHHGVSMARARGSTGQHTWICARRIKVKLDSGLTLCSGPGAAKGQHSAQRESDGPATVLPLYI